MAPEGLEEQFLRRMVDASKTDIPRLQRWLAICWTATKAAEMLQTTMLWIAYIRTVFFRLIDVEENCIVPAKGQPFFALSYV